MSNEGDPELIIFVPFVCTVTLKSFMIIGNSASSAPTKVRIWANREDVDFSNCNEIPVTQEFELSFDGDGVIDYPTNVRKFQNVSMLCLHFPENGGADSTRINYIGLKGDSTGARRQAVITIYEARPVGNSIKDTISNHINIS
eukprot:TRINITY_DN4039_c0_g1_i3.p1 TRINITY_DN4039_c0_g1~~TRINITY_DN4039_c0_g1_i3.p1  ORF type:complete len:143 (-),score=11.90 TRINITY_DN4039_c0_g1_i3:88-516(-)